MKTAINWSLLALLVGFLAFSGWRTVVYRHARGVEKLAERSGGHVDWVYRPFGMKSAAAASRFGMITRARIFNDIESVSLGNKIELSPSDLRGLRGLPRLRRLRLRNPSFRSESWRVLGSLDGVEELEIHFLGTEATSLQGVGQMRQVRSLRLWSFGGFRPDDDSEWWSELSGLTNLERLYLTGFGFKGRCLKHLPELPSLIHLQAGGKVDEEDLLAMARFESLREIEGLVELSDDALDELNQRLPSLERIGILRSGSPLTEEGRKRFKEAGITIW